MSALFQKSFPRSILLNEHAGLVQRKSSACCARYLTGTSLHIHHPADKVFAGNGLAPELPRSKCADGSFPLSEHPLSTLMASTCQSPYSLHPDNNNPACNRLLSVLAPFEYREIVCAGLQGRQLGGLLMCQFPQGDSDSEGEAGWTVYNWSGVIFPTSCALAASSDTH